MRSAFAPLALAALAAANPFPGAVSGSIAPSAAPPSGCSENYAGSFQIQIVNVSSSEKRDLKRVVRKDTPLTISLKNGVLMDSEGRTGYIAANDQFQFDDPPQAGAIYTAGFSVCSNGSLALGGQALWYKCLSGSFYNIYDVSTGGQCSPVYINVVGASSATTAAPSSTVAAESSDGQITATPVSSECSEYVDGQPQCSTVASASAECSEYVDGQPQCSSAVATASAECSEYVDGQPQCSSAVATSSAVACSEYVDGQPQCSTLATGTYYVPSASYTGPAIATGAANILGIKQELFGLAAGILAVAAL